MNNAIDVFLLNGRRDVVIGRHPRKEMNSFLWTISNRSPACAAVVISQDCEGYHKATMSIVAVILHFPGSSMYCMLLTRRRVAMIVCGAVVIFLRQSSDWFLSQARAPLVVSWSTAGCLPEKDRRNEGVWWDCFFRSLSLAPTESTVKASLAFLHANIEASIRQGQRRLCCSTRFETNFFGLVSFRDFLDFGERSFLWVWRTVYVGTLSPLCEALVNCLLFKGFSRGGSGRKHRSFGSWLFFKWLERLRFLGLIRALRRTRKPMRMRLS